MAIALKPCPFCGKQPESRWHSATYDEGYWGIDCCGAFAHEDDEAEAAAKWNARPVEDRLTAALQPFADFAAHIAEHRGGWDHDGFDLGLPHGTQSDGGKLMMREFRRARAELTKEQSS